jgi:hypothetical protein
MAGNIFWDTLNLKTLGIYAVRGSYSDFLKLPDVRPPSTTEWEGEDFDDVYLNDGNQGSGLNRPLQSRDISLTLLLSGSSVADMFSKRDDLVTNLTRIGSHTLTIEPLDKAWAVYYKSCESCKFFNAGKKRLELVLKFRILHGVGTY